MRVLVTGGAGFIGTHVRVALEGAGLELRILDSLRPDVHRTPPPPIPELQVGDVRDPAALDTALAGVDAVVHLAAKVGLGVDVQDLPDYADSNMHGTAALLAAMARAGVDTLVQASSMVVYGEGFGRCPEHGPVTPGQSRSRRRCTRRSSACPRAGKTRARACFSSSVHLQHQGGLAGVEMRDEPGEQRVFGLGGLVAGLRASWRCGPAASARWRGRRGSVRC